MAQMIPEIPRPATGEGALAEWTLFEALKTGLPELTLASARGEDLR
ncbi:MAG: hypothetical protein NT009_09850 [Proteobacteria bacterium]|jgi:hypothetical protein|nr:hypothetical protein [Pseudomonadota bacterium]